MITVKIYKNTTDQDMSVVGVGTIPAGEQVSLSSENLQPVMLANYPGLVDMTEFSADEIEAQDSAVAESPSVVEEITITPEGGN